RKISLLLSYFDLCTEAAGRRESLARLRQALDLVSLAVFPDAIGCGHHDTTTPAHLPLAAMPDRRCRFVDAEADQAAFGDGLLSRRDGLSLTPVEVGQDREARDQAETRVPALPGEDVGAEDHRAGA